MSRLARARLIAALLWETRSPEQRVVFWGKADELGLTPLVVAVLKGEK